MERVVKPLGLVAKGQPLVPRGRVRRRAPLLPRLAHPGCGDPGRAVYAPARFDLAAYWTQSTADFVANLPRYPFSAGSRRTRCAASGCRERTFRCSRLATPRTTAGARSVLLAQTEAEACSYVLGFGALMLVVEPMSYASG